MPVLIEQDTNLPRVVASGTDPSGVEYSETESVVYRKGQVVYEDDLTPETVEALESGDEDLSRVARVISESEAEEIEAKQAGVEPVAPEHEAEAEVLSQDGKDVLTREEVVESNPNGDVEPVEEEEVDLTEGREAEDPESIRIKEVDAERRGDKPAPKAKPAAGESKAKAAPKKRTSGAKSQDQEEDKS